MRDGGSTPAKWGHRHDFKSSLKSGQASEASWLELMSTNYPEYSIQHMDGRSMDFLVKSPFGPFSLELKTESRCMTTTENVFIERFSNFSKRSPGGPFQALEKGIDLYCHFFPKNGIMLTANTKKLVDQLNKMDLKESKLIGILNKGYVTKGWKVARKDLYEVFNYCYFSDSDNGLL